jgi:D-beta-D-heptose 7-phosphate kinase/D-beta-D-heptose 1-phosphate adenosyltransferase
MDSTTFIELLDSFHRARVLVVGDVMLDRFVYGSVHRISPEAPIPVLKVERTVDMPGGAANVARNVATLGAQAILIGATGDDSAAVDLRDQLKTIPSIEVRLIADKSRPTTLKTRHVAERQQILRADIESSAPVSEAVAAAVVAEIEAALPNVDIVVLSDYAKGALSEAIVQSAIDLAKRAGKPVLVDPKSRSFLKYRGATVLTPNRLELQLATESECETDEQIVSAASGFVNDSVCTAIAVTRGKDGMSIVRSDGSATHLRAVAKEVFDVSGAGDTVVATMAIALSVGADLADAAKLANYAAGIVVGKSGTAAVTTGELIATVAEGARGPDASKHFTLEDLLQVADRWRDANLRIAFTNGCFDLLHPGHVSLLTQAKKAADRLVVGLNSDLSVRRLKGDGRPAQSEAARATVLASLACVDAVVIFSEDTPFELIQALRPDVLVKGADYTLDKVVGADLVRSRGGEVLLVDLVAGQSTTNTLKRVGAAGKP